MRGKLAVGMVFAAALGFPALGAVHADEGARAATSDSAISSQIKSKLSATPDMRDANIGVTTHNGVVTLSGTVASRELREAAVDQAASTTGVIRVDDHLRLIGNTPADPEVPMR